MLTRWSSWRTALLIGLFALPLHVASAQDRAREARSVASFTAIEFRVPGTLHLRQGDEQSVEVEAPPAVLEEFDAAVEDGTLELPVDQESNMFERFFGDDNSYDAEVDVYVTAPTIEALSLTGSGRIEGETPIEGEALSLNVAGSGGMTLEVASGELDLNVAGSGTTTLRGRTRTFTINVAGSGDLEGRDLETETAEVRIAGSGDVELYVTEELSASIFGSGDVRYRGQPTVSTNSVGSGTVSPIE